ncbi:MAG: squalene/phytoene synthase family protein [Chromatiaceae bacterium]|jgi:phytoene synthase|nr:squalene/phytoene synthase family protein [Chromatiaceae bacterium]
MQAEWRFPNRATPAGSSAYYSVRFAPAPLRHDLAALHAWRHQVRAIRHEVSDPGVARLKLQWWRAEVGRTFAGEPRHPLSQVLAPAVERHRLPAEPFHRIADRVEAEILRRQPADETELGAACEDDLGALFELLARCHGRGEPETLGAARRLGGFCARVYLIRDSGALARQGRAPLPADRLRALGLSVQALGEAEHRRRLPELLAPAAKAAWDTQAAAEQGPRLPASLRVRARILAALLAELERSGLAVGEQRIGLTPLRKLWLAWREAQR